MTPTASASLVVMASALAAPAGWAAAPAKREPVRFLGEAMKGPFATLSEACARCHVQQTVEKPAPPFLEVKIVVSDEILERPWHPNLHYLAARLPSGWWMHEIGGSTAPTANSELTTWMTEQRVETTDVLRARGAEILVETHETHDTWEHKGATYDQRLHICGVGRSGRPSCFDVHTDHSDRSAPWHRPATFRKDRTLVLGSEPDEDVCVVRFP